MTKVDFFGVPILTKEELAEQQWEQFKEESRSNLPPEFASLSWSPLPSADEGSQTNREVAQRFMRRRKSSMRGGKSGITILESDTATGKSHAMADAISQKVKRNPNTRVLVVVENHNIAEETRIKFEKRGVEAVVYRGAEAKDPDFEGSPQVSEPDPNLTLDLMCKRAPARQAANKIDRASSACVGCPFHPVVAPSGKACGYQKQARGELRDQIAKAQVVIVTSDNFVTGGSKPSALKRKPSWKWNTFSKKLGKWTPNEAGAERGNSGLSGLDFTHIWVDEFSPQSIAMGATNQISTETLGGVECLIKQGVALGVDISKAQEKLTDSWGFLGLPGEPEGVDVEEWIKGNCLTLRDVLSAASFSGTQKDPARVTLGELESAGLSIPVLKTMRSLMYSLRVAPIKGEEEGETPEAEDGEAKRRPMGAMSAAEIEEEFALLRSHNASVDKIRKFISAILTSAERLDARNSITEELVSHEATRRVDSGEAGGVFLGDIRNELSGRYLPLPGVKAYQRLVFPDPDSIESIEVSTVSAVQRGSLGNLIKTIPTMITAAAQDHSLVSAALGIDDLEFAGSGRVRDGEGVMRAQSLDTLFSKSMIVPSSSSVDADGQPIYSTKAENAARVSHDVLVTAAMSGQVFSLSGAESGSERVSVTSGLITHQRTRGYIKKAYPGFEDQVIVGHFGATTGSNDWEGVRSLTIAGRQAQDVRGVEADAEVIFEREIERVEADEHGKVMFEQSFEFIPDRHEHGVELPVPVEKHPDEDAEIIREALTSESLLQAEARGRAARRTADTPLTVNVATCATLDRQIDEHYTRQEWRARTGIITMPLALGVFPASARPGKYNLNGLAFQLIGRAGCAALGNETGALPGYSVNPVLLKQEGEEATPSACSLALHDELRNSPLVRDLVEQIEAVIEHGEAGKSYRVAGLPMVSAQWYRVTVTIKGSDLEVHARGDSEAEAQRRAESVLLAGLSAVEGAEDGMVEIGDVQIPVNTTHRASVAADRIAECNAQSSVIPLTSGTANALYPEVWGDRMSANRDLSALRDCYDGAEVSAPEMDDLPPWARYRAIFEIEPDCSVVPVKSLYKGSQNNSVTPKSKTQKWPGVISADLEPSSQEVADANLLSALLAPNGGAVVKFKRQRKSAKQMTALVTMDAGYPRMIKKVLSGPSPEAADGLFGDPIEKAQQRWAECREAEQLAKKQLIEARDRTKEAKAKFEAGEITKVEYRAIQSEAKPLREAVKSASEETKLARSELKKAESKKPDLSTEMTIIKNRAEGLIEVLLGTEKVDVEVVALIPPGLEIDMNPVLQEAALDQEETQPEEELTEDERVELELHIEHLECVKARHEEMLIAGLKASIEAGNLPWLEELEAELCPP